MAKITLTFVLVTLVITVQGVPSKYDDIVAAARSGLWDQVHDFINGDLSKEADFKLQPPFESVRKLKPANGGHVYGEAEYTFHASAKYNGKTAEETRGHKVINQDGKVKEFDFTPSTVKSVKPLNAHQPLLPYVVFQQLQQQPQEPFKTAEKTSSTRMQQPILPTLLPPFAFENLRNLKPVQGGKVYGEAEYSYHAAANVNGRQMENTGGHKVINDNGHVKEFDFTPTINKNLQVKPVPDELSNLEKEIKTFLKNNS